MTSPESLPQPPNPLGNDPTHRPEPLIAMLAVPKSWTRLVVAVVVLLFIITCVVTFMVWLSYLTAQINSKRIDDLNRRLGQVEAHESTPTR